MTLVSRHAAESRAPITTGSRVESTGGPVQFGGVRALAGWYHPARGASLRDCAVVICNPLGYEELCAHRALRAWAIALAQCGIATLRFDYDGTGNSAGGDADPARVDAWIDSIEAAVRELRARSGASRIVLLGVRLGATLALATAGRVAADAVVLFGPPASGKAYARELRAMSRLTGSRDGRESAADQPERVGGFTVARATIGALEALDPFRTPIGVRRALVLTRDDVAVDRGLIDRLAAQGIAADIADEPGYAAMMVDAHQSVVPTAVIERSVRWLLEQYDAVDADDAARLGGGSDMSTAATVDGGPVPERLVRFDEARGLFGVLSEPPAGVQHRGTGIVLANAGSVHTVGPGRIYVELARAWSALGFTVLRIDVGGVGDSDAREESSDNHPYPTHAADDLESAARWLRSRSGVGRVVLGGVCSGAHASFHAALRFDGIAGIIMINPIVFYWKPGCPLDVSAWTSFSETRRYSRSMRDPRAWMRLFRGRVHIRIALTIALRRVRELAVGAVSTLGRRLGLVPPRPEDVGADLRRLSARGVDVLLVFSDSDPGLDFLRRYHGRDVRRLLRERARFSVQVVPDADHTFSLPTPRARLHAVLTDHLLAHFD